MLSMLLTFCTFCTCAMLHMWHFAHVTMQSAVDDYPAHVIQLMPRAVQGF